MGTGDNGFPRRFAPRNDRRGIPRNDRGDYRNRKPFRLSISYFGMIDKNWDDDKMEILNNKLG